MEYLIIAFALCLMAMVAALLNLRPLCQWLGQPKAGQAGDFVAEVWLDWTICRGSTMFRQRYASAREAEEAVRWRAKLLDELLPTRFRDTDASGTPIWVSHDYSINYGVRRLTAQEREQFQVVWSTLLPGVGGYRGEHPSAHPLEAEAALKDLPLAGSTHGFKL